MWRLESLCDDDGSQYEEVRIELLPKHMGTNISVKENGDLVWTEGQAVWSISWWIVSILAVHLRRLYESTCEKNVQRKKTQDKQYSNSNRRKWSQVNRKLPDFPFKMHIIGVNDCECSEGSYSQLLGICQHLSVVLSDITMWYFVMLLTWERLCYCHFLIFPNALLLLPQDWFLFFVFFAVVFTINHKSLTLHRTQIKYTRCTKVSNSRLHI